MRANNNMFCELNAIYSENEYINGANTTIDFLIDFIDNLDEKPTQQLNYGEFKLPSESMENPLYGEVEHPCSFKWDDGKVIDFVNWYLRVHNISSRFELENQTLIDSYKNGDDPKVWR